MNFRYLVYRFWYFFWFIALPLAIAWGIVDILDRAALIDEFEFWYVLLLFAVLAFTTYSIRDKLPFWQDRDPKSALNRRRHRKEAQLMLRNVRKILVKKASRISERGKTELGRATDALASALENQSDEALADAVRKLDEKTDRYLAFARKSAFREYFESIGIAVLVAVVLRLFVVEAFKIPSESMVPTLMVGDHIFVSKYRYGLSVPFSNKRLVRFTNPQHGDVVVFIKPPTNGLRVAFGQGNDMAGVDFIKRIIGLPGDTVELRRDVVYVNGKEIPRCHVGKQTYRTRQGLHSDRWGDDHAELWIEKHGEHTYTIIENTHGRPQKYDPIKVPHDHVFVMGDNRDNSNDSRQWGFVPFDNIKGRAMFIWWSNLRPHGFQWNRVGTAIMKEPKLDEKQRAALARCQNMR